MARRLLPTLLRGAGHTVYGAVTTGTAWKFLRMRGTAVEIDLSEYALAQPERVLGILLSMLPVTIRPAS